MVGTRSAPKPKAARRKPALSPELSAANQAHTIDAGLRRTDAVPQSDHKHARAPSVRLLDKAEICAITNVSFPTIWSWMRAGKFPRGKIVGGKSMWLSNEIDAWLADLPTRPLKGDVA
jgi:predicted DNA-binding transcriptional regulator AlpA